MHPPQRIEFCIFILPFGLPACQVTLYSIKAIILENICALGGPEPVFDEHLEI